MEFETFFNNLQKTNEAELKYRLHRCLLKQHKREEAMGVLGSIAENEMPPKVCEENDV